MFQIINPKNLFSLSNKIRKILFFSFIILIVIGLLEALWFSPKDYTQSHAVRIMYVHVPSAWISLGTFSIMGFLSIFSFIFKNKNFLIISKCLASSGFMFSLVALVTGSIWGKPTWGTWWAWDSRITAMLLLGFFYLMYILSWQIFEKEETKQKISTIIAILGIINIPIIKFSVDWWSTLHQSSSVNILSKSTIHSSMMVPLVIMTVAFVMFSAIIFLMKYNAEIIKLKNKGLDRL